MKMNKKLRTVISVILSFTIVFSTMQFGFAESGEEYVSGIYVTYAKKTGDKSALQVAKDQFKTMFSDETKFGKNVKYEVLSQDFNKGADALMSSSQPVYIAITKTKKKEEAIRDISAMNMDGGYTFADYETILQQKYDDYEELARDEAKLIEEYRKMVNAGSKLALYAKDKLNNYYEDDSNMSFGDYLMDCQLLYTDEEKQALENEKKTTIDPVVLMVSQMTNAVLSNVNTLLTVAIASNGEESLYDRISALTPEEIAAYQEDPQYYDQAVSLLSEIKTLAADFESAENAVEETVNDDSNQSLSDEELAKKVDPEDQHDFVFAESLKNVKYGDSTLYELFTKENLSTRDLYPVLGVMSEGQRDAVKLAGLELLLQTEFLVSDPEAAAKLEENTKEVEEATADNAQKAYEEMTYVEETLQQNSEEEDNTTEFPEKVTDQTSIYVGVDRTLLNKTLAFTTDAQRAEQSHAGYSVLGGNTWIEGRLAILSAFGLAAVTTGLSLTMYGINLYRFNTYINPWETGFIEGLTNSLPWNVSETLVSHQTFMNYTLGEYVLELGDHILPPAGVSSEVLNIVEKCRIDGLGSLSQKELDLLYESAKEREFFSKTFTDYRETGYYSAVWGTVFWVALGVTLLTAGAFGVAETYAYYHPSKDDFSPRPEGMLDVARDENGNRKTIMYSGVYDTNGEIADINGWVSRNWVALYTTKDPDAGNPIIADATYDSDIEMLEGLSPVHLFGSTDAMSFNDYAFKTTTKIYLGFMFDEDDDQSLTASLFSGTRGYVSTGILSAVVGFILGAVVIQITKKKRKNDGDPAGAEVVQDTSE